MERVGGSEREPCVVRNRRERRGRALKFLRRPGERSQPRPAKPPRCSVSVASPRPTVTSSNYRICKTQANKCPLEPNTKQAPARTSKQTNKRGQAKHNFSHLRPPSPSFSFPSSFLHSIFVLLLLSLPGCGSEAADSSSQTPQARALLVEALGGRRQGLQAARDMVDVLRVNLNVAFVSVRFPAAQ
jgi:hypothetical protein